MFQPSTSRDPLLTRGGDSDFDSEVSMEEHAFDDDFSVWGTGDFTDVDEDQTSMPISETTAIEGVDAKVLTVPDEDQRFTFVEFSPDWSLMVAVTSNGTFSVWDTTDEFDFLGSRRFQKHQRTLKRIAFDPYNKEAVLLCFDSGDIFRVHVMSVTTEDVPGNSQIQGMFDIELVSMCQGRAKSRCAYFTFSSDREMMVYYNFDKEFVAVQFEKKGSPKRMTLSENFVLKQVPNIYVTKQNVLISAILQSSEDRGCSGQEIETLLWSHFDFSNMEYGNKPVRSRGKGYLSNDGKHVLISVLIVEHQFTSCHIEVYWTEDFKSTRNKRRIPVASKTLKFESNYPRLECLDREKFKWLTSYDGKNKPLIIIHQASFAGSRLTFWDTDSDALVYEVDLALDKEVQNYSDVKYCFSLDCKWVGVYYADANMVGLICLRSGVFVWTLHFPVINTKDVESCRLKFEPSGTRLLMSLGKMVCLFEPSWLAKKPQKHPMLHNLCLSQTSKTYDDFEILEMTKAWPKPILFNVLLAKERSRLDLQYYLLDATISSTSKRLAVIIKTKEGRCLLSIVDYSKSSSWDLWWFVAASRWNQCLLAPNTSHLVKEIGGDQRHDRASVFYYPSEVTCNEQIILVSSKGGIEILELDSELRQLDKWKRISNKSGLSLTQSKDGRRVIALLHKYVFIIDLNKKAILKSVKYLFGLSQWWASFMHSVQCFGYSQYHNLPSQEVDEEHKLLLQDRLEGFFDVSDDGETILIGWDSNQNRSLILTPIKSEEQFRIEWDEARESLYKCSMLTKDGQWIGYIDYERLRCGDVVVCIVDTLSNRQKSIWLGSNESLVKPSSEDRLSNINLFLRLDECEEKLIVLGLDEIGASNKLTELSVRLVFEKERVQDGERVQEGTSLLESMVQPTQLEKYGEKNHPSTFNMRVANISNFHRVLVEEGEQMMECMAKNALENNVKVSDVYMLDENEKQDSVTLLEYALNKKEASLVKLSLLFIENGVFPYHSSFAKVKKCFFDLLFSHPQLFLPILRKNSIIIQIAELKVPSQYFDLSNAWSEIVFTSDTVLNWSEHFVRSEDGDFLTSNNIIRSPRIDDYGPKVMMHASISLYCIANACKVGLNGIIGKLLMLKGPRATFSTDLVRRTVTWKWEKLYRRRCLVELSLYIAFLALFTFFAIAIGINGDRLVEDKWLGLMHSLPLLGVMILALFFTYNELMQLATYINDGKNMFDTYKWGCKHYFLESQWNGAELLSYFLVLVIIPLFYGMYIFEKCSKETLFVVVAIESLLAWFKIWYYAQPFEKTSALVYFICGAIFDFIPFLFLALVILVGFSVAFYIMFQCCSYTNEASEQQGVEEVKGLIHDNFGSPWRSLSTLFYAMVGSFEPKVYYNHRCFSWLTTLMFISYMALEMIVMLNMLIAVMGDMFDRVKNEEDAQIIISQARFINAFEASLSHKQRMAIEKRIGKFLFVLTPKEGNDFGIKKSKWKGRINVIEEIIKKVVKENIKELELKIEEMLANNNKSP